MPPKGSGKNHTPLKPPEDSSPTYEEKEDISFRVSKLEDMIKGSVKIDDFVKLEEKMATKEDLKEMASKEDLKGMASKEDLQDLKEFMKDIKHNFIPHLFTQEEDKEEKNDLFQSRLEKLNNNWRVGIWSPQKLMIQYNIMGSIQVHEPTLSSRLT